MSQLTVIRASAGSGKTHALTGYYLQLLFRHHDAYFRSILAVTFTNKATGEMKERIVGELFKLASGAHSLFIEPLQKTLQHDEATLRSKAARLLNCILQDYSWFSIETIDRFFQRIIRSFARELGVPGNYSIQLNMDEVLDYAIDHLIEDAAKDPQLLEWLTHFAFDKIAQGKSWDFRSDLSKLGRELFNETFASRAEQFTALLSDYSQLHAIRTNWHKEKIQFEQHCRNYGEKALQLIEKAELSPNDFNQKSRGATAVFKNISQLKLHNSKKEFITQQPLILNLLNDAEYWPHKDSKNRSAVLALVHSDLQKVLNETIQYIRTNYTRYCTLKTLTKTLYPLGILVKLSDKVKAFRYEKNTFILSDAPVLIERLIRDNDTPFLYEKMGNRYRNYLIDEFQDTSSLQWNNFRPLMEHALSQADDCLLVGDAKQSIYRWRNGDWDILARQIQESFRPESLNIKILDTNWRSCREVVDFNNALFRELVRGVHSKLEARVVESDANFDEELKLLANIYEDVAQHCAQHTPGKGNVHIRFFENNDTEGTDEKLNQQVIDSINTLLERGYQPGDMAILVRKAKEGKQIADLLIEKNSQKAFLTDLQVISNESLFLTASHSVQLLVAAFYFLHQPDETFYRNQLAALLAMLPGSLLSGETHSQYSLPLFSATSDGIPNELHHQQETYRSLPLYELTEQLISLFNLYASSRELPYLHAFLNVVHEFTQNHPGNLSIFLDYWEKEGQSTSVSVSESQNAIRILTIHKSKGLEFKAVLIPFGSWNLDQKTLELIWATLPGAASGEFPAYPVEYTMSLRDTQFAQSYYQEMFRAHVDNLNLLYVALTRAVESLIVFSKVEQPDSTDKLNTTGDLLYQSICNSTHPDLANHYHPENRELRIGFLPLQAIPQAATSAPEEYISPTLHTPAMDRLFFGSQALDYFSESHPTADERKLRGKVLHNLLAGIRTTADIQSAVGKVVYEGWIAIEEGFALQQHIENCLLQDPAARWFDGSGEVVNEAELLLPGGATRRPDRVIIWDNLVHIVDYKFGSNRAETTHQQQVREYIQLLLKMGYTQVKGFLWYIDLNEVIPVN